jgi:outer membrane protein assembly factor BamB
MLGPPTADAAATVVYRTGDPASDVAAVRAAVRAGGKVLLKAGHAAGAPRALDRPSEPTVSHDRLLWENRGQQEWLGWGGDMDGAGNRVVATNWVGDQDFNTQWSVRGLSRQTGATVWEDTFGPAYFAEAKDVAVERDRAFVAGYINYPGGGGYHFVVRAYDLASGVVLWSQEVGLGPQCLEESPGFARCVAKAVAVQGGRVFVVGHLTRTAARQDFAVLAFDAGTGEPLWESVTDPTGTGASDYGWAVAAVGRDVFVLGEVGDFSGMALQAHDARTGAIRWQQQVPGASNVAIKETLAADRDGVFIAGMDAQSRFFVQAYEPASGRLRWEDHPAAGLGQATGLALGHAEQENGDHEGIGTRGGRDSQSLLFAAGVTGCNTDFFECEHALRAYDPLRGLQWQRADQARGGDWFGGLIAVGGGRLHVGTLELLEDGLYHPVVRSHRARDGAFLWDEPFDDGGGFDPWGSGSTGSIGGLLVQGGRLLVSGMVFRPDVGQDFLTRAYRAR